MEKLKIDVCKNLNNIEMAINTYIEKRELEISKTEDLKNIPPWDRRYKYIKQEQIKKLKLPRPYFFKHRIEKVLKKQFLVT